MAESYTALQVDSRTFGEQERRLLEDLNRPDLSGIAISYLQDSMRFWQRKPFFFNDIDNTTVGNWAASTIYPQGSTIYFTSGSNTYVAIAANAGTSGSGSAPSFTTTLFTSPTTSNQFPPPTVGTAGTTLDNDIIWLTQQNATSSQTTTNYWTQLSTVYGINEYTPPLDFVAPRLIEVTPPQYRYQLTPLAYSEFRDLDTLRPAPVTSYPTFFTWYQQKIYLWPYPDNQYPLTLSYTTAPDIARNASDSNIWTTKAENLIRAYAAGLICQKVLLDPDAAQMYLADAKQEFIALQAQTMSQQVLQTIPATDW